MEQREEEEDDDSEERALRRRVSVHYNIYVEKSMVSSLQCDFLNVSAADGFPWPYTGS